MKKIPESNFLALTSRIKNMTQLDEIYMKAVKDEDWSVFYDDFLTTILYVPTHSFLEKNGQHRRTTEDEEFSPMIFESGELKCLLLFDSEEKLYAWAKEELNSIGLRGHTVVEVVDLKFHWVLNPGTKYSKTFAPEEIKSLKQKVLDSKGKEIEIPEGTSIIVSVPDKSSNHLIELLVNTLIRISEVRSAYLGQVYYMAKGEVPHLMLMLEVDCCKSTVSESIKQEICIAVNHALGESDQLDIMIKSDSGISKLMAEKVVPFYVAKLRHNA